LKFWKASNFWRAAPISFEKARFLGGCRILEGAVGFEKTGFFFSSTADPRAGGGISRVNDVKIAIGV
jgi:hypothetical protein